jgi:hypothetical protein
MQQALGGSGTPGTGEPAPQDKDNPEKGRK